MPASTATFVRPFSTMRRVIEDVIAFNDENRAPLYACRPLDFLLGSISAVFSSPVFDPPESAGSFPEQRLVIEPNFLRVPPIRCMFETSLSQVKADTVFLSVPTNIRCICNLVLSQN